jgi:enamine deaminase RidA (YjgF/YER057c/UK114 family)
MEKVAIIGAIVHLHTLSGKLHMNIQRLNPTPRWSDATVYRGIAHFVEVPNNTDCAMTEQIAQVLTQAEATLAAIGSDKSHLLSATIYLTDRDNVPALNQAWASWLPAGCAPSRACIKVELLDPAMLVEIAFVAAVD